MATATIEQPTSKPYATIAIPPHWSAPALQTAAAGGPPTQPPRTAVAAAAFDPERKDTVSSTTNTAAVTSRTYADGTPFGSGNGMDKFKSGIKLPKPGDPAKSPAGVSGTAASPSPVDQASTAQAGGMIAADVFAHRMGIGVAAFRQFDMQGYIPKPMATVDGRSYWRESDVELTVARHGRR